MVFRVLTMGASVVQRVSRQHGIARPALSVRPVGPVKDNDNMTDYEAFQGTLSVRSWSEGVKLVGICQDESRNDGERYTAHVTTERALDWADRMTGPNWDEFARSSGTIVLPWYEAPHSRGIYVPAADIADPPNASTYEIAQVRARGGTGETSTLHAVPFDKDGLLDYDGEFLLAASLRDLATKIRRAAMKPWLPLNLSQQQLTRALAAGLTPWEIRSLVAEQGVQAVETMAGLTLGSEKGG